ncbi:MAG TPA: hypothetical protein VGM92_00520 [Candidatus Kapabacteria bacterium]
MLFSMRGSIFKRGFFFGIVSVMLATTMVIASSARAQNGIADSSLAYGRLRDAFGLRVGIIGNWLGNITPSIHNSSDDPPVGTGVRPSLEPYYEAHLAPGLTGVATLMLVYRSFAVLDLSDIRFESYGFNFSTRWEPAANVGLADRTHLYFQPGIGFDTFDDRVSFSVPLRAGTLLPMGTNTELELGALVTPELFLGVGPGMYYGITAGIRFLNAQ